jgi:selenocysteine lyase/cysteine desulfurase
LKSKYTPEEIREMMYGLDTPVLGDKPAINLDNAATTPPFKAVIEEINEKLCWYGSIGRGVGHTEINFQKSVIIKGWEGKK